MVKFRKWCGLFYIACITNIIYADNVKYKLSAVEPQANTAFNNQNSVSDNSDSSSSKKQSEIELSEKLVDPLAKLMFIPLSAQNFIWTNPSPVGNKSGFEVSLRPTVPVQLNEDFIVINHAVLPYFNVPNGAVSPDFGSTALAPPGYSNIFGPAQFMSIIALNKSYGLNIGVGPYVNIPFGTVGGVDQNYGLGVAGIVRYANGPFLMSTSVQNAWSVGQNGNATAFSQFMVIPNIAYNFEGGWALFTMPYITADFTQQGGDWMIPVGLGVSKVSYINKVPFQFSMSSYENVVRTPLQPEWTLRATITMILPE